MAMIASTKDFSNVSFYICFIWNIIFIGWREQAYLAKSLFLVKNYQNLDYAEHYKWALFLIWLFKLYVLGETSVMTSLTSTFHLMYQLLDRPMQRMFSGFVKT
jgi:hypothetical protein